MTKVTTMSADFENLSDDDELWLSDLETRAIDLENELSVWRESRQRALGDQDLDPGPVDSPPHESFRRAGSRTSPGSQSGPRAAVHTAARRAAARSQPRAKTRTRGDDERTRRLINQGRSSARRGRFGRGRTIMIALAVGGIGLTVLVMVVFRPKASWPASVAVVQNEITTACQNPNVVSEPIQVNFSCGKATSQILWVFSLMTSGDNPNFTDSKSGRQGLEPISAAQG